MNDRLERVENNDLVRFQDCQGLELDGAAQVFSLTNFATACQMNRVDYL